MSRRRGRLAVALAALALVAACAQDGTPSSDPGPDRATTGAASPSDPATPSATAPAQAGAAPADDHGADAKPARLVALRPGEKRMTLKMPEAYTPSAPNGVGTDDYHCFILDPKLDKDVFLTGFNILPGNPGVVHHVILFRVPPDQVDAARTMDEQQPGQGWTCFGDIGFGGGPQLDDAPWLGAWAPGGSESVTEKGFGTEMDRGSKIVMQVHYNLLAGTSPDVSSTQLRYEPRSAGLTPLQTMLLPAPVELPCRPGHRDGPLCERDASMADVKTRFGQGVGATNDLLHFLCNTPVKATGTTTCTRNVTEPMTIRAAAGHMHLLGRSIKIEVNPGTPRARTVLDIPLWDFDNQGSKPVDPVALEPFDTVKVTCRHVQWLRDQLPSFEGQPDRYVVWGEGTTDEMCLGILTVTHP
jgi:hypothetical protein